MLWVILLAVVVAGLLGLATLILRTRIRKATSDLRAAVERMQGIAEALPDALLVLDADGRIVSDYAPPHGETHAAGSWLGLSLSEAFGPEVAMKLKAAYTDSNKEGESQTVEYYSPALPSDGPLRHLEARAVRAGDELVIMIRDISEERITQYEERRRKTELERIVAERTAELVDANRRSELAVRTKGEFISSMSHEFRTPLNSIIGFTGLMLEGLTGEFTDEQHKQLEMVYASGKHLLALVADIRDLSKIETGHMEPVEVEFDVCELVESVAKSWESLAERKGLALTVIRSPDAVIVHTDRRALRQILISLVGNAIKFTSVGQITLEVLPVNDGWLEFRVIDTGVGIPKDELGSIFEELYQAKACEDGKPVGTGLGLAISKRLTEMLGGLISAESVVDQGSVFTVRVPVGLPKSFHKTKDPTGDRPAVS